MLDRHHLDARGNGGNPLGRFCLFVGQDGFHARFQTPVQLRPTDAAALPPGPLRVQMIDCDGAYLNNGRPEYWA